MWGNIVIAFVVAFITTYVFTPFSVRLAKKVKAWDIPKDKRKIHKKLMPRLGGVAIVIGFCVSAIFMIIIMILEEKIDIMQDDTWRQIIGFFIAIFILELFCYMDDTKGIKPIVKLIGQVLATCVVLNSGIVIDNVGLLKEKIVSVIFTIVWIVGITNAINLMDGLDGLSAGLSLISSVCFIIVFALAKSPIVAIILATALAGALAGFLPFNFNPARTFMGDTGSNFIGFTLAVTSVLGITKINAIYIIVAAILILIIPILDTSFAIIRRLLKNKSISAIFVADRSHFHHKLIDRGYTQKQTVAILYGISAIFGIFAIILIDSGIWKTISFALFIMAIIAIGYKDILKPKKRNL